MFMKLRGRDFLLQQNKIAEGGVASVKCNTHIFNATREFNSVLVAGNGYVKMGFRSDLHSALSGWYF